MRHPALAALGLFGILILAACGGGSSPGPASDGGGASAPPDGGTACVVAQGAGDAEVSVLDFAYDPSTIQIGAGQTVAWTNGDSAPHTVTLDDGSCDAGQFAKGETVALTFSQAGSYAYHCTIHPNMQGTVEVSG